MKSLELLQQAILRLQEDLEDGLSRQEQMELLDLAARLLRIVEIVLQQQRVKLLSRSPSHEKEPN